MLFAILPSSQLELGITLSNHYSPCDGNRDFHTLCVTVPMIKDNNVVPLI